MEAINGNETSLLAVAQVRPQELAKSRAQIYAVLSAICARLPGEQLVRLLSSWTVSEQIYLDMLPVRMKQGLKQIGTWLERHNSEPSEIMLLETEFTRLFRGLGRANSPPPPYESVYVDGGLLYGRSTQSVADTYRRFHVAGQNNEPPDYIALELDFMRLLCDKEAQAWQSGNGVQDLISEEGDFLRAHLGKWVPAFCKTVRRFDTTSFYAGFVDIMEGWILCDRRIVNGLIRIYRWEDTVGGSCVAETGVQV